MAKSGNNAQFTYDFGIAIAQSTVNKVARLTGATLTLASAFYALRETATKYVNTLRENTLRFGGVLSTMKAMEQAQDRLIKGQSYFSVDDQLRGMNQLMAAGVNVGKNLDWINKAAHATGKSYAEFSGMISSAIQGNSQALVDAGLMTQRATRMFDKYAANTVMRQQAILNFVKNHKGLLNAIKNDFETIQDQMTRIKAIWRGFLASIVGKPNDPQSFYGQIVSSMKMVAEALSRNMEQIKRYGFIIGQVLGWVIKQIGHFVVWLGRQVKKTLSSVWKVTDDFQSQARSLLVWLEFWKLKVVDFFKEYSSEIKTVLKLLIAYKALKAVFVISDAAIASVMAYRRAFLGTVALQKRYMRHMDRTGFIGKIGAWFTSLAAYMPRGLRKVWVSVFKSLGRFETRLRVLAAPMAKSFANSFSKALSGAFGLIKSPFKALAWSFQPIKKYVLGSGSGGFLGAVKATFGSIGRFLVSPIKMLRLMFGALKNLWSAVKFLKGGFQLLFRLFKVSNPVGWILLAIDLIVILYKKSENFRVLMNNIFKFLWESLKFIWNLIVGAIVYVVVGLKRLWKAFKKYVWNPIADFFKRAWGWVKDLWKSFMNTKVGKWINDHIVEPIRSCFEWVSKAWNWVLKAIGKAVEFLAGANSEMAKNINELANAEGLGGLALAAEGGTYDTKDSTDYLDLSRYMPSEPKDEGDEVANPLIPADNGYAMSSGGSSGGNSTNMTFNNGAIQVIVNKGEDIDENRLAQKIRGVLNDMKREGNMRGGMV